jgi:predicted RNA-binding protein with PUA-like domain
VPTLTNLTPGSATNQPYAQARNVLREMRVGDLAFFYHSSCKVPVIVGICEVVREAYPDHTALDPNHVGYDSKFAAKHVEHATKREHTPSEVPIPPKWYMVDVKFVRELQHPVKLAELREESKGESAGTEGAGAEALKEMVLLKRARLSVQPVSQGEWDHVMRLEEAADSE